LAVALVRSAVDTGAVLPTRPARSQERPIEQPVKLARHRFGGGSPLDHVLERRADFALRAGALDK
jgi:hypothetical protein